MNVTMYSRDGQLMETVEAKDVIPLHSSSGFMSVVLKSADFATWIEGGDPERYFSTNLPLVIEGGNNEMRQPEPTDKSFTVKLLSDAGILMRMWQGAQGPHFHGKIFGFKVDGEWVRVTGNVIYEPE
jgi:hypothetical protein